MKINLNLASLFRLVSLATMMSLPLSAEAITAEKSAPQKNGSTAEEKNLQASEASALYWLKLVDESKYGDSWESASVTLKLTVPKKDWITLMEQIRKPLGNVSSRKLADQRTATNPKGLPQGDYMIFVYRSSFSKKESVNELVTLILESDGVWRVLTYLIQ